MAANPLTLSPTFSSSNLSELSDFELIDQDRDAWSSNDADSQSDAEERSLSLSHNNSFVLEHPDHGTDAWDSLHLVDPTRTEETLNERNERIADELGRETSSVESFVSDRGDSDSEQREESADRTLTDIEASHPDMDSLKESDYVQETLSKATGSAAEELRVDPAPPANGSSNIRLLFPDPIEGSAISYDDGEIPVPGTPSHVEAEEDTDVQSSVLFESVSSLASVSSNGNSLFFNIPLGGEVEVPAIHVNMAAEDEAAGGLVGVEDEAETDEEPPENAHFVFGGLPAGPTRDPPEEVIRPRMKRELDAQVTALQLNRKESNASSVRFDRYTTKRNLLVCVLSVIICSACCLLYCWKATVARFDLSISGLNYSAFSAPGIFSALRFSPLTNQDASKPSIITPMASTSMVLTIDPTPALRTIDGPKTLAHLSLPSTSTMPRTRMDRTTDLGSLLPHALTKYIPPSTLNPFLSTSRSSNAQSHQHTATGALPFIAPLKDKLCEAHSLLSERHERAKSNARKLGEMGKKVWNERCGNCVSEALGKLRVGLQGVAGAVGDG